MNYTMASLDLAIDLLLPKIAIAKKAGIDFDRPGLIKMVAMQHFVDKDYEDRRDFNKSMCYHVVTEAAICLHKVGWIEFGDRVLENEIVVPKTMRMY